jgi:ELWxxDGT repeat protein
MLQVLRRRCAAGRSHAFSSPAESLERRVLLSGGSLLADINQTTDMLDPSSIVAVGDVAYFAGRSAVGLGAELWKTDGTRDGTVLVKEIAPGLAGSEPRNFTAVNGTVFFTAADPVAGRELWRTDGTAAGTVRVRDIRPGADNSDPAQLTAVGDTLFFAANDGTTGLELWRSDGTEAGTVLVRNIASGTASPSPSYFTAWDGALLFVANRDLWRSDGTLAGTQLVTDVQPGAGQANVRHLTVMADGVYFAADPGGGFGDGRGDLFRTDGTAAGTVRVKQINLNANDDTALINLTRSGDLLYFLAGNPLTATYALWRSDGTDAGTFQLRTGTSFTAQTRLTPLGNETVVFPYTTAAAGMEPWVSDGTVPGTQLLTELNPGAGDGVAPFGGVVSGSMAFFAPNAVYGKPELWATDGTPWGTYLVGEVAEAGGVLWPQAVLGGRLLFSGLRYVGEGDLYASDGTPGAIERIGASPAWAGTGYSMSDLTVSNEQSQAFVRAGPYVYFEANDGTSGDELWRTDPDAAEGEPPVVRVADVAPGGASSDPAGITVTDDGTVYFTATTPESGRELYRVLPGGLGAERVRDLAPGAVSSAPRGLSAVGNVLYFNGRESEAAGFALWRYDPADNTMTKETASGQPLVAPSPLVRAGNNWYFTAHTTATGRELYRTNGTRAGTRMAMDVVPGSAGSFPDRLTALGDTLYFRASGATGVDELWKSGGTPATTVRVTDFAPAAGADTVNGLFAHGGFVYVARSGTAAGVAGVWRSDGTAAGTVKVADASAGGQFAAAGGDLLFVGSDANGVGVFKLDGVPGGATRLTPAPGSDGFVPATLYAAGGDVYVVGTAANRTRFELWKIEVDAAAGAGTAALVRVLAPRVIGGMLSVFWGIGRSGLGSDDTYLYFPAHTEAHGIEPYRLPLAGVPAGAAVVGRHVLGPAAGGGADVVPQKQALLPGEAATFDNVTSHGPGINGVAIDVARLPSGDALTAADFELSASTDGTAWAPVAAAASVTVGRGAGDDGADRVTLTFPDGGVRNAWLRVKVLPSERTGLARADVFYFGNLPGETGDGRNTLAVNALDLAAVRRHQQTRNPAALARYDFNRDGAVNAQDVLTARANLGRSLPLITAPPAGPAPAWSAERHSPGTTARRPSRRSAWAEQIDAGAAT